MKPLWTVVLVLTGLLGVTELGIQLVNAAFAPLFQVLSIH